MGYGFIRSEQQIKSLILFGMSLMPVSVTETDLLQVISMDEGFTYLDFAPALQEKLSEPVFPMDIYMKKPWEITNCEEDDNSWQEK